MATPAAVSRERTDQRHKLAQQQVQAEGHDRSAPSGGVVYEAIRQEGEDELSRATPSLAWSGLAAGLSMGFSFAVPGLIAAALPDTPWRPLVAKLGYSAGFLIVILGRQQLFTENTLTVMLPLLRRRDRDVVRNVGRLWLAVLAANLAGTLIFALVIATTSVFHADVHSALSRIAQESVQGSFGTLFLRAVFAGWLIALMVWLLPYAEAGRFWVIGFITYVVALGQFPHVIAGSVDTLYLVITRQLAIAAYVGRFLIPALLGNIVGGVSLVAALAHAQFVAHD